MHPVCGHRRSGWAAIPEGCKFFKQQLSTLYSYLHQLPSCQRLFQKWMGKNGWNNTCDADCMLREFQFLWNLGNLQDFGWWPLQVDPTGLHGIFWFGEDILWIWGTKNAKMEGSGVDRFFHWVFLKNLSWTKSCGELWDGGRCDGHRALWWKSDQWVLQRRQQHVIEDHSISSILSWCSIATSFVGLRHASNSFVKKLASKFSWNATNSLAPLSRFRARCLWQIFTDNLAMVDCIDDAEIGSNIPEFACTTAELGYRCRISLCWLTQLSCVGCVLFVF